MADEIVNIGGGVVNIQGSAIGSGATVVINADPAENPAENPGETEQEVD